MEAIDYEAKWTKIDKRTSEEYGRLTEEGRREVEEVGNNGPSGLFGLALREKQTKPSATCDNLPKEIYVSCSPRVALASTVAPTSKTYKSFNMARIDA
jgi:hypothetical protein